MAADNPLSRTSKVVVGIGCRRGCPLSELQNLLDSALVLAGIGNEQIQVFATSEHKGEEPALRALASSLNRELILVADAHLQAMCDRLSAVSTEALRLLGVPSVAEASALACADRLAANPSRLLLDKRKSANATLAIAVISEDS